MPDYGLDTLSREDLLGPAKTPAPVAATPAAPKAPAVDYGLGAMSTQDLLGGPVDPTAEAEKAAALFEASFKDPTEEVKRRNLAKSIEKLTGIFTPAPVMDVKDSERAFRLHEADHATRASPRTSAFLSVQENADVAMQDAKTMAQIERVVRGEARALVRGTEIAAKNLPMGLPQLGAWTFDLAAIPPDFLGAGARAVGLPENMNIFAEMAAGSRRYAKSAREAMDYLTPTPETLIERGVTSGSRSAGMMLALAPAQAMAMSQAVVPGATAAVVRDAAMRVGNAVAGWFGVGTGAEAFTEARDKGKGVIDATTYAIPHGAFEYLFEIAPSRVMAEAIHSAPGLKAFVWDLLKTEVPGEQATTLSQNFNTWANLNPDKPVADFLAEQPGAMAETFIATLVGAGLQAGAIHTTQRATGYFAQKQEERRIEQQQQLLTDLFDQAKQIKADPVTFQNFMAGVTDNTTVFINAEELRNTLAQNQMDSSILPSLEEQLSQPSVTGDVEIPIGELMTAFAGTPAQEQVVQHARIRQDDLSAAEQAAYGGTEAEFFRKQAAVVMEKQKANEQFTTERAEIEADIVAKLQSLAPLSERPFNTRDFKYQASLLGAFYATAADLMGTTPKQVAAQWAPKILGTEAAPAEAGLTQGFSHGNAMLNVGLDIGDVQNALSEQDAIAMLQKFGVTVTKSKVHNLTHDWGKENTLVAHLDRALTPDEMAQLLAATQQEAIPQYADGVGTLYHATPEAATKWGPFNPEYFRDLDGVSLAEAQQDLAQKKQKAPKITDILAGRVVEQSKPLSAKQWADVREIALAALTPEARENWLARESEMLAREERANREAEVLKETAQASLDKLPKPRLSTVPLLHSGQKLKIVGTGKNGKIRVPDVGRALYNKFLGSAGDISTEEGVETVARALAHEALASMAKDGHAVGWYDRKVHEALLISALIHPELATDPKANLAFRLIAAVTSNGQAVRDNFILTNEVYAQWKATGKFPTEMDTKSFTQEGDEDAQIDGELEVDEEGNPVLIGGGQRRQAMIIAFDKLNNLAAANGWETLEAELMKLRPVGEIKKFFDVKFSGELVDTLVPSAVGLGGPKIGNFFANLSGGFDTPTMDLWFMRTVGRMTGGLLSTKKSLVKSLKQLRKILPEEGEVWGYDVGKMRAEIQKYLELPEAQQLDPEVTLKTLKVTALYARAQYSKFSAPDPITEKTFTDKSPANLNARSLIDQMGAMVEAPGNGTERNQLRSAVYRTLELLEKQGIKLTAADLQAVLWYHEKNLYSQLGDISESAKPWDYASAARFGVGRALGLVDVGARQRAKPVGEGQPAGGLQSGEIPGGDQVLAQTNRIAGAVSGPVVGIHYSQQPRASLASSAFGSGMPGAERERLAAATDPRIKQRVAFYVNTGSGITPESGVGPHAHAATLRNLYDADADALKIWRNSKGDMNAAESAVLDAGFDGYLTRNFGGTGAVVMLGSRSVDVQGIKKEDVSARAEIPPSAEIPKMKQAAMAIVNNRALPFGRQSVESWKRDIERSDPDTAALIKWDEIPAGDYYKDQIAAQLWQKTWYYSALQRALEKAPAKVFSTGKATAQWLTANAGKMGVKAAELEATGVTDWLETQGKVTQEQVVSFVKQGGVKVEEVVLGEVYDADVEAWWGDEGGANEETPFDELSPEEQAEAREQYRTDVQSYGDNNGTKFETYQLPGGANYKELLITLPPDHGPYEAAQAEFKAAEKTYHNAVVAALSTTGDTSTDPEVKRTGALLDAAKAKFAASTTKVFNSSHYPGAPNILAHLRFNERTDADGKRVLFIEEVQSDWAQKGRKSGFNVPVTGYQVFVDGVAAGAPYESKIDAYDHKTRALKHNAPDKVEIREVQALQSVQSAGNKGLVPLAPFVQDTQAWTALALKRAIAYAVDNGFDRVAWTTGEQQAARYDLSKQISRISYAKVADDYFVQAVGNNGQVVFDSVRKENELEDVVGKEVAQKIINGEGASNRSMLWPEWNGPHKNLSGLDLKVGGEGMKGYYDGIVPQVANDVLKKLGGGKVQQMNFYQKAGADYVMRNVKTGKLIENTRFTKEEADAADPAYYTAEYSPREMDTEVEPGEFGIQPGFQITPAMREAVGQGLPLFAGQQEEARRGSFNPLTFDLRLLADANRSTFIHELSHFFMAAYIDMASQPDAPPQLKEFVENLLGYLFEKVPGGEQVGGEGLGQKVGAGETAYKAVDVNSPEFKAWAKNATIKSEGFETGEAVVIRGQHASTYGDIAEFHKKEQRFGKAGYGFYFSNAAGANLFAEYGGRFQMPRSAAGEEKAVKTYPVFVAMQNPLVVDHVDDLKPYLDQGQKFGVARGIFGNLSPEAQTKLQKQGYDGIIARETTAPKVHKTQGLKILDRNDPRAVSFPVYVVFEPTQIKSAISNTGEFSNENPSILRQNGEAATPGAIPEGRTNLERWNAMTLDQQRAYWEFFAEGFEQYAMTGKAPTKALQSAFSAFAKWMKDIYKTLVTFVRQHGTKPLDAELTQYFDRMLATDEELGAARQERGFQALFKKAAEAGMSPGQFADYMALDDLQKVEAEELLRSRSLRDMKWLSNAKTKAMKELQAEADELRALVQASVEEELASTPIRQAERWLRKGEMVQDGEQIKAAAGHRLDTTILKAMFPEGAIAGQIDFAKLGRGSNALASTTGTQHPDDVAAIFGFRNGEDLVRQLIEMQPFKEEVQQLTDLRMLEEHGDLASPQAIAKAADEAIHNDAHLKMVATEVWALSNRTGSVAMLTRAAKAFAAQLVDNTVVKKLSPSQYANAATRAGKAAVRALAKKEVDKAANEKRTEMVNAAAAKAAYAAEAEVRAIVNRLRKISAYSDKHSATTSREFGVVQAVRAILSDFGIGQHGEKATKYLNTLSEYDPVLGAVLDDVINKLAPEVKPWDQLKVADLRELHAAINGLWTVARDVRSVELAGEKMSLDDARAQLIAKLEETQKTKAPTKAFSLTKAEERNQDFMSFAAKAIRPESWISTKDGLDSYGPWRRLIWNTIDRAELAYNADKTEKLKQLKALLEPIAADMVDVKIDAPELGGTFGAGRTIGYSELLHAILHTGNLSNKTKLLLGRGWGSLNEDGTLDSAKWDAFMARMFAEGRVTKAHMDFVQSTWDLLESMKKGAQDAHKATTGRYFEEIEATALVTPYGTYRGGYAPAIVDHQLVAEADLRKMQNAAETEVIHSFEKPAGGFTKSRVAGYNQPLELNIAALGRHIDQVLLFSHMSIPVRNVQRVLKGKDLSSALAEQDRAALGSVLAPWLHSAATQTVTEKGKLSYESLSLFTKARSRAGAAIMFANVSNSVQQLTGFFPATLKVSKKELLFAAAKGWYKPRELAASVAEMSPYMQQRLANEVHAMAEEIDHILLNPTKFEKAQDWAIAHSYFLQMAVDTAMSPIIWQAKFNEETARGAAQQEAVDLADAAVRMTQGTNRAIDIAAMEKGSPFYRMFMQFAGYFNTQANLVGEKLAAEALLPRTPAKYGRIGMILAMGWWAPAIATALIVQLFRGGVDDDDQDGEWLDDWLVSTFIGSPIRYAVAAIPVFGTTINAAVNSFNNKPYDDRISVSPAVSLVEGGFRGAQAAYGAIEDPTKAGRAIRDLGTFLSLFTGVPVTPATRAAGFATDVETGKVSPTSGVDYGRGIITGTASPESK